MPASLQWVPDRVTPGIRLWWQTFPSSFILIHMSRYEAQPCRGVVCAVKSDREAIKKEKKMNGNFHNQWKMTLVLTPPPPMEGEISTHLLSFLLWWLPIVCLQATHLLRLFHQNHNLLAGSAATRGSLFTVNNYFGPNSGNTNNGGTGGGTTSSYAGQTLNSGSGGVSRQGSGVFLVFNIL